MHSRLCLLGLFSLLVCACAGGPGTGSDAGALPAAALPGIIEDGAGSPSVAVATLNLLHGLFCPEGSDGCRAPARLQLLAEHLEQAGCPELVGLQEVGPRQAELIPAWLGGFCGGRYLPVWADEPGIDREMVLTTLPVQGAGLLDLTGFPWEAVWVRVRTAGGTVDFLTAHFASSANNPVCAAGTCPAICPDGIPANQCHAVEVVDFFASGAAADLTIVAGDLNAEPGGDTLATLLAAGFRDVWEAAGEPPCDPASGRGCTGGGDEMPTPLGGLDTPAGPSFRERIDYVLARPADHCLLQVETAPFAASPAASPVDGMFWVSDHAGVMARLDCRQAAAG